MNHVVVEMAGLTKRYGSQVAVDHLDLTIHKGEIFGLLGPNGAGKSTTILMMLGLTEPDEGYVKVCGNDSAIRPIEVKRCVGYLPEDVGFYDEHSGLENLVYTARLNGFSARDAREKAVDLLNRVGLSGVIHKKTGKYSRGMRQRLGLADVLIKNPEVIILDEPTLGIDPTGVREFLQMIVDLSREEDITVLFSSHHLHQVQQVCDRVGLFVGGKLLAEGDIRALSQKLVAQVPYTIEAGISWPDSPGSVNSKEPVSDMDLDEVLADIEGVVKIQRNGQKIRIECSHDITSEIARAIIHSGTDLHYLVKKEFGLDDIYHRYFEGGVNHE